MRGGAGSDVFAFTGLGDAPIAGLGADFGQIDRILDWGSTPDDDDRIDLFGDYFAADYEETDIFARTMEEALATANLLLADGDKVVVVPFQDLGGAFGVLAFWDTNGDLIADQAVRVDNITIGQIGAEDFF